MSVVVSGLPRQLIGVFLFFFVSGCVTTGPSEEDQIFSAALQAGKGKRYVEASELYISIARRGHRGAQNNLGILYENGLGVRRSLPDAIKWYRASANQGDFYGQNSLADMYHWGKGMPKDLEKAIFWYSKAAAQEQPNALYQLGNFYYEGKNVKQDKIAAYKYWRRAEKAYEKDGRVPARLKLIREDKIAQLCKGNPGICARF